MGPLNLPGYYPIGGIRGRLKVIHVVYPELGELVIHTCHPPTILIESLSIVIMIPNLARVHENKKK